MPVWTSKRGNNNGWSLWVPHGSSSSKTLEPKGHPLDIKTSGRFDNSGDMAGVSSSATNFPLHG